MDNLDHVAQALQGHDVELQLAGGATDQAAVDAARAAGAEALILGEALFNGSIDYCSFSSWGTDQWLSRPSTKRPGATVAKRRRLRPQTAGIYPSTNRPPGAP